MQATHATVLSTLQRVQRFMDTNAEALGPINTAGYRRVLDDVANTLSAHAVSQAASKNIGSGETAKQRVLRNALKLNTMRPIAAVAAAQLKEVPEFASLKMPAAGTTSARLVAAAGAMSTAATTYQQTFTDAGLPADFLDRLNTAAEALNNSLVNRGNTKGSQAGATAGLKAEAARGREAVRVLDALIEPQLAGNAVLLVQWNSAKRFGGKSTVISSTTVDAAAKGVAGTVIPPAPSATTTTPAPSVATSPASVATPVVAPVAALPSTSASPATQPAVTAPAA